MPYYPAGSIILKSTTILRDRMLPAHVYGKVLVEEGDDIKNSTKVVAEGIEAQDYRIIDVAAALGIAPNDSETLAKVITLQVGEEVQAGVELAQPRRRRDRKYIPAAPANGVVTWIERGQIILQIDPKPVYIYARFPGRVVNMIGEENARGVQIQSTGSLIQCAWGNGQFAFGRYEMEPASGLASLRDRDSLLDNLRGVVYILERPLGLDDFRIVVEKQLGGLVAPSMSYDLRETAMLLKVPIILTEGFGNHQPTARTYEMLRELQLEREGAFDAITPTRWQPSRPEIFLPSYLRQPPPMAVLDKPLKLNDVVRLRCVPYEGQIGQVTGLPETAQTVENGLRVAAAQIRLKGGKTVIVPRANVELMGDN